MGWLEDFTKKPLEPKNWVRAGVGAPLDIVTLGGFSRNENEQARIAAEEDRALQSQLDSQPTPVQMRQMRENDIASGMERGREIFFEDPIMKELSGRRKDLSQGLNAEELDAQRRMMTRQRDNNEQAALRQLMAGQGRAGVGGSRAAAQRADLQRKMNIDRGDQERQMVLNNYEARRQGLDDYQKLELNKRFGQLSQGMGEAQLGVSDRTGYMQNQIAQQMAAAANQQPKKGVFGQIFEGLGL